MKVLIVNASDTNGGAARAAYRLHQSILNEGIDTQLLVTDKGSGDFRVIKQFNKYQEVFNKIQQVLLNKYITKYKNRSKTFYSTSWIPYSNFASVVNEINPDVVHLHWVSKGSLNFKDLLKIKAPIVWSLHDMWLFTGGCHYDDNCGKYIDNCGKCPVLGSNSEKDLSRKVFNNKQKVFKEIKNLTVIGLSNWLKESAAQSSLLMNKKVINLPNPIDLNMFKPIDAVRARELWNLPKDKKLLLFGAMSATSDPRKGYLELSEALKKIDNKIFEVVIFGSSKPESPDDFGFKTHYMGQLSDDVSLVTLYNAVDVMVVPSLQENLSNTIMESLACGTPVVSFDIGGNKDMINHKLNGYLASPLDIEDLANGIKWVLLNENYEELKLNAIDKVTKNFESSLVGKKYVSLYNKILLK